MSEVECSTFVDMEWVQCDKTFCRCKRLPKIKNVKAIAVLRIDSPGGSALTSDLIWRRNKLLKKTKLSFLGNYTALVAITSL
jgi:ClpP class serine protease